MVKVFSRFADAFLDPQRRKQVAWRCVESLVGLLIVAFAGWPWVLAGLLAEFVVYEYILEPLGLSGPYWERTPPDGKTFTRW